MFCCKIVFRHFLAVMQVQNGKIIILNYPKLTEWLIFTSSLRRHPDCQSIIICTPANSFSNMSKTGKNLKNPLYIRYNFKIRNIKSYISVITSKSVILKKSKIRYNFKIHYNLQKSVWHLRGGRRLRGGDFKGGVPF